MDLYYKVTDDKYLNVKEILKDEFCISSRLYLKLRNAKQIFLNSKPCFGNEDISLDNIIEVSLSFEEKSENIVPTEMKLNILYEDSYLLIVNKPANMPVHPSMRSF